MERMINWLTVEWGSKDYYLCFISISLLAMLISLLDQLINRKYRALDFSIVSVVFCVFSIIAMMFFVNPSVIYVGVVTMTLFATGIGIHIMSDNAVFTIQFFDDNRALYKKKNVKFCLLYFILILSSSYLVY